jgi:uncharacterized protein CbrC (UPF0167 family)
MSRSDTLNPPAMRPLDIATPTAAVGWQCFCCEQKRYGTAGSKMARVRGLWTKICKYCVEVRAAAAAAKASA